MTPEPLPEPRPTPAPASRRQLESPILTVGVDSVFHTIVLLSLFLLFVGHNAPGGGFVGGLVAAAALVLRFAAGGTAAVRRSVAIPPTVFFGVGLLCAVGTGLVPAVIGDAFLESNSWDWHVPVLGDVHLSSVLFFDIGVYLIVVGLVLTVLSVLGEEAERGGAPHDDEHATAAQPDRADPEARP